MMKIFQDIKIKRIAKEENIEIPEKYHKKISNILDTLEPVDNINKNRNYTFKLCMNTAIAVFIFSIIILPNINSNISYAMQKIPVLGNLVKIVTIKEYFKQEGNSELELDIPEVKNEDNSNSYANDELNKDAKILTERIIKQYNENKNPKQYYSVELNSEIITNDDNWFTLKLITSEVSASSDTKYKYYNIDKKEDKLVNLSDLFINDKYKEILKKEIERQMELQMNKDINIVYWIDGVKKEWDFVDINENTNYYFSNKGNIVIVFNKYEVGPGSMGTPEFEIPKEKYIDIYKK